MKHFIEIEAAHYKTMRVVKFKMTPGQYKKKETLFPGWKFMECSKQEFFKVSTEVRGG